MEIAYKINQIGFKAYLTDKGKIAYTNWLNEETNLVSGMYQLEELETESLRNSLIMRLKPNGELKFTLSEMSKIFGSEPEGMFQNDTVFIDESAIDSNKYGSYKKIISEELLLASSYEDDRK